MPARVYIDGGAGDDNRYIIKVGDAFADTDKTEKAKWCCAILTASEMYAADMYKKSK